MCKSTRSSFKGKIRTPSVVGAMWYVDVWGPDEVPSLKFGNVYIIGFIEAVSKKAFVYFSSRKVVFDQTKHLVESEIPVLKNRFKDLGDFIMQSDNGEFRSNIIESFINEKGGKVFHSCSYTPETQAIIERLWRTITELASTMLSVARLPEPYWEEATKYSAFIYNNIPASKSLDGKSPTELLFKTEKPELSRLRAFAPSDPSVLHIYPRCCEALKDFTLGHIAACLWVLNRIE